MGYSVTAHEIDDYAGYLTGVAFDLATIRSTIADQGCNNAGFIGVLDPLNEVFNGIREHINQAFTELESKLLSTRDGLSATARTYGDVEQSNDEDLRAAGHRTDQ